MAGDYAPPAEDVERVEDRVEDGGRSAGGHSDPEPEHRPNRNADRNQSSERAPAGEVAWIQVGRLFARFVRSVRQFIALVAQRLSSALPDGQNTNPSDPGRSVTASQGRGQDRSASPGEQRRYPWQPSEAERAERAEAEREGVRFRRALREGIENSVLDQFREDTELREAHDKKPHLADPDTKRQINLANNAFERELLKGTDSTQARGTAERAQQDEDARRRFERSAPARQGPTAPEAGTVGVTEVGDLDGNAIGFAGIAAAEKEKREQKDNTSVSSTGSEPGLGELYPPAFWKFADGPTPDSRAADASTPAASSPELPLLDLPVQSGAEIAAEIEAGVRSALSPEAQRFLGGEAIDVSAAANNVPAVPVTVFASDRAQPDTPTTSRNDTSVTPEVPTAAATASIVSPTPDRTQLDTSRSSGVRSAEAVLDGLQPDLKAYVSSTGRDPSAIAAAAAAPSPGGTSAFASDLNAALGAIGRQPSDARSLPPASPTPAAGGPRRAR